MPCLIQLGVNTPGHMCFILFAPHLSFPLPNPRGETTRGELAQSEPGPLVHKSLHGVVQGVSLSRKPSWTRLSSHPLCSAPIKAFTLHWEHAVQCRHVFPAECVTLSSLYPHGFYSAHTQALITGRWVLTEWMDGQPGPFMETHARRWESASHSGGWSVTNSNAKVNP